MFTYLYQVSTSLLVRMNFASGYAAISSSANAMAGKSETACFLYQ